MSDKSFWPWAPLLLLCVAVVTYGVARWSGPAADAPRAASAPSLPPAVLRALGSGRPRADPLAVHDLGTLRADEAALLDGKRARFRVVLDSPPSDRLGRVCYDCATPDDVERTLFLRDGTADRASLEVEGTLRVIHHPPAAHGDAAFVGFTEYRLVDAERP